MTIEKWILKYSCPLDGKTIVLTGANGNLGREILRHLAELRASVVMAVRNIERANELREGILSVLPDAKIYIMRLDISSDDSIDEFSRELSGRFSSIDILINNAGIYHMPASLSPDGNEIHYATNCHGPLCLTKRLMPFFAPDGKIIFTTSIAADFVRYDDADPYGEKSRSKTVLYGRTKLALERGVEELKPLLNTSGRRISVVLWHPGISATELFLREHGLLHGRLGKLIFLAARLVFMKPCKACLGCIYAVCNPVPDGYSVGPRGLLRIWGYPTAYVKYSTRTKRFHTSSGESR